MANRAEETEDVSVAALSISNGSVPISMYGPGSVTAAGLLRLGRCILGGISLAIDRNTLATITRRIKGNRATAAQDSWVCEELLELSRPIIHSDSIARKAWDTILCFIKHGEVSGLVDALSKRREVEIQIFLNEALLHMPADWIVDPLIERSNRARRVAGHIASAEDKLALPRGFLKLLCALMYNNALALTQRKPTSSRGSQPISLASFVSASGKMVLGPPDFQNRIRVQIGQGALHNIIKSILCGRLNTMSTRLRFEVGCSQPSKEMVSMLAELLVIFRSFPDDRCIQRQCRELLFVSISRFHAVALVKTLASWSKTELLGLISEFASWLKPFVYSAMLIDGFFPKAYRSYLSGHSSNDHPVIPFLYFCIHMSLSSEAAATLLLDLDLVDMVREMCLHDFPNPAQNVINTSQQTDRIATSDIYASLTLLFAAIAVHPPCCARLLSMSWLPPWIVSIHYTTDFIGLPTSMVLQDTWRQLDTRVSKLVLVALENTLKCDGSRRNSGRRSRVELLPLEAVYRDLIAVIRDKSSEQEMVYSAADTFLTCVEFGSHSRRVLNKILSEARVQDTFDILEGIHLSLAPDFPPYNPARNRPRRSWVSTHSYLTALAHAYAQELRMYSPLVDELLGSRTCNGRFPFGQTLSNQVQVRTSILSSHPVAPATGSLAVPIPR